MINTALSPPPQTWKDISKSPTSIANSADVGALLDSPKPHHRSQPKTEQELWLLGELRVFKENIRKENLGLWFWQVASLCRPSVMDTLKTKLNWEESLIKKLIGTPSLPYRAGTSSLHNNASLAEDILFFLDKTLDICQRDLLSCRVSSSSPFYPLVHPAHLKINFYLFFIPCVPGYPLLKWLHSF